MLPNVAFALFMNIVEVLDKYGEGIQFHNIFDGLSELDNFSTADGIMMLLINGLIYMTLACYIENVLPGKFGVPLPLYYPFTVCQNYKTWSKMNLL